jgi:predicted aspartyl protease
MIGHPRSTREAAEHSNIKLHKELTITALIDTGASRTVINPQLATTCGLRQTGEVRISGAGQVAMRAEFAGSITFPGSELSGFDPLPLIACPLPEQDISCLIGRDVLERWNLTYDGRSGLVEVEEQEKPPFVFSVSSRGPKRSAEVSHQRMFSALLGASLSTNLRSASA